MNREEALVLLAEGAPRERLRAARFLAVNATVADHDALQAARQREGDIWISAALDKALRRARSEVDEGSSVDRSVHAEFDEEAAYAEVYAQAVEETTQRIVHELRQFVGTADYYAKQEIDNYKESRTRGELEQLGALMDAVERLGQAAAAPAIEEFDLGELISEIAGAERDLLLGDLDPAAEESERDRVDNTVELLGARPAVCLGDRELVGLAVRNGLRNAIEATGAPDSSHPGPDVVVNWNETDDDYWVVVLDRGPGLPAKTRNLFEIAVTNKDGHFGMGLALAHRAALSLNGALTLAEREGGGALFEFRWPRPV